MLVPQKRLVHSSSLGPGAVLTTTQWTLALGLVFAAASFGQGLDNSSLTGRYGLVRLEIAGAEALPQGRNLLGSITFNGVGGYQLEIDPSVADADSYLTSGGYDVSPDGTVEIDDPARPGAHIEALLSADLLALAGSAIDAEPGFADLMIAIRSAEEAAGEALDGAYKLGLFQISDSGPGGRQSALVSFRADGAGGLSDVEEVGHRDSAPTVRQQGQATDYEVVEAGMVETEFSDLDFASGVRRLFVSEDGNYVVGVPTDGSPGIFAGARRLESLIPDSYLSLFSMASIGVSGEQVNASLGTVLVRRGTDALVSSRRRALSGSLDFSGRNHLSLTDEGDAWLSPEPDQGGVNLSIGVDDPIFTANAGIGASVDAPGEVSDNFGLFFLLRPFPLDVPDGLFADSRGIVHAASFSRAPSPLVPGMLAAVFGNHLIRPDGPDDEIAGSLPLPVELAGMSITVDGVPAPLLFASRGQVNFQVPVETTAGAATIVISNGEEQVEVTRRVGSSNPGLFFIPEPRSAFAAIVSHADGSLVTPEDPAHPGETVVFWATGFGLTDPPVGSGSPNPGLDGGSLAVPVVPNPALLIAGIPAEIHFVGGTPGFVGLSQINATIPLDAPTSDTVPVAVAAGDALQDVSDLPIGGSTALTEETTGPARGSESSADQFGRLRRSWQGR